MILPVGEPFSVPLQHLSQFVLPSNLTPVNRRKHKGPRDDTKKTKVKMSATRRAAIIDTECVTERSKDTRTAEQKKNLILWVCLNKSNFPSVIHCRL